MKTIFSLMLAVIFLFLGQEAQAANMNLDDIFFQNGKYYVVAGVLVIIFIVLFIFLWRLDRKVSELEKEESK